MFPNANQARELEATLETHRRLYNAALDARQLCYETAGIALSCYDQCRWLTHQRKQNKWYAALNATSAVQTLRTLDKAYRRFFTGSGRPRFKSRDRFRSFRFSCDGHGGGCKVVNRKLRLQGVGLVRLRWHRELPDGCDIVAATILRECGKWFVCFTVEESPAAVERKSGVIGIDVGLKAFVTTSEGEAIGDSKTLDRNLKELRVRQRALSRCKIGSNTRKAVKARVTSLHAKVRHSRADMHHKVSRSLVDRYGIIAAERLNILGMLKNHRLARRISDAGWYQFITILTYKAASAGGQVIQVDPKNTTQACSACGEIVPKSLDVRIHSCACGCVLDRDVNAAKNILGRAVPGLANVNDGVESKAFAERRESSHEGTSR